MIVFWLRNYIKRTTTKQEEGEKIEKKTRMLRTY